MGQKNQSKKGITCTCAAQGWPSRAAAGQNFQHCCFWGCYITTFTAALRTKRPQAAWRPSPAAPQVSAQASSHSVPRVLKTGLQLTATLGRPGFDPAASLQESFKHKLDISTSAAVLGPSVSGVASATTALRHKHETQLCLHRTCLVVLVTLVNT